MKASTLGDNGYGDFVLNAGAWTYTLNNAHAAVQALDAGESLTDIHTFTASDGSHPGGHHHRSTAPRTLR